MTVAGAPSAGTAPADAPVAGVGAVGAAVGTVVGEMLATSDNNTAELLVKELGVAGGRGRHARGRAGRDARDAGRAGASRWTGVVLADGSGLSNDNRVTCEVFVDVLARSRPDRSARRRPARSPACRAR